ncbi:MAG: hypothetical protein Q9219_005305 [cf. Caloplaca sp. 3 TL-2023]
MLDILSDGPLEEIKAISNITTALESGRKAIRNATQLHEAVASQSALIIERIWNYFGDLLLQRPEYTKQINRWQIGVQRDFKVDKYLSLADRTRQQIESRTCVIQKNWGVSPTEVINQGEFNAHRTFSKFLLEQMAKLSEEVRLEEGREMLRQAMVTRQINKKGPLTLTDGQLKPRDVLLALEKKGVPTGNAGKRKRRLSLLDTSKRAHGRRRPASNPPTGDRRNSFPTLESSPSPLEPSPPRNSAHRPELAKNPSVLADLPSEDSEGPSIEIGRRQPSQTLDDVYDTDYEHSVADCYEDQSRLSSPRSPSCPPLPFPEDDATANIVPDSAQHQEQQLSIIPEESEASVGFLRQGDDDSGSLSKRAKTSGHTSTIPSSPSPAARSKHELSSKIFDSTQREVPTTDKAGALTTLAPREWLSGTAIELVLDAIRPDNCAVVDSEFANLPKIGAIVTKQAKFKTQMWLPVHRDNHWMLVILKFQDCIAEFYDSGAGHREDLMALFTAAKASLDTSAQWTVKDHPEYQQTNDYDCGILVLLAALCSVGQVPLPSIVDSLQWRTVFRCLIDLSTGTDPRPPEAEKQRVDAPIVPTTQIPHHAVKAAVQDYKAMDQKLFQAHEITTIVEKAFGVVREERMQSAKMLISTCTKLEQQSSAYEHLEITLAESGISEGLEQVKAGIKSGREVLESTLIRARSQRAKVEESIQGWDAAMQVCQVAHASAENQVNEAARKLQQDVKLLQSWQKQTDHILQEVAKIRRLSKDDQVD